MRKISELKCIAKICIISLFFTAGNFAFAIYEDGLVHGRVTDTHHQGITGVRVVLSSEDGLQVEAETNQNGEYQFNSVAPGYYVIAADPPRGWQVSSPGSGFYEFQMLAGEEFEFDFLLKGVVIDFGKPPETGGGTIGKASLDNGNNVFRAMVSIRDIDQWDGDTPYQLVIDGVWAIPGAPDALIELVDAEPQGAYILGKAKYVNLGENRFQLVFESLDWPGLAYNGNVMLLRMVATKGGLNTELKVDATRIKLGSPGRLRDLPITSAIITQ